MSLSRVLTKSAAVFALSSPDTDVKTFMDAYRTELPDSSVFPKLHYLEDHIVPFTRQWRVGPGILGEHGGESIHRLFNQLLRQFGSMPLATTRLVQVMKHHLVTTSPILRSPPNPTAHKK